MRQVPGVFTAAALLAAGILGALFAAAPARAESCPGNPDALGTSRTIVVSPQEYQRIGSMQYKQKLPLNDHEVVLTFDDGPLPPWSDRALDILKSQCVKVAVFHRRRDGACLSRHRAARIRSRRHDRHA